MQECDPLIYYREIWGKDIPALYEYLLQYGWERIPGRTPWNALRVRRDGVEMWVNRRVEEDNLVLPHRMCRHMSRWNRARLLLQGYDSQRMCAVEPRIVDPNTRFWGHKDGRNILDMAPEAVGHVPVCDTPRNT